MANSLTKAQKHALRAAAELAHRRDRTMSREDCEAFYLEAETGSLPIVVGGAVARGIITADDVGEAARQIASDVAETLRHIESQCRETVEEADPHDPDAVVSVEAIVGEIDLLTEESTLYLNEKTGEVRVMHHEYLPDEDFEEMDEEESDDAEWLADAKAEGREVVASPDWIALLDRHDFNEYEWMRRFARSARPAASRDLSEAIVGRGAFRRFREVLHARGLVDEWDECRKEQMSEIIRFELKSRNIPFRK